jgi:hypothetical protein
VRTHARTILALLGIAAAGASLPAMVARASDPIPLKLAKMIIELNDTAGDVGIQISADGEPWDRLMVEAPDGWKILDVKGKRNLGLLGSTELFMESHEPSFDEMTLEEVLALFPEGIYAFSGNTVDGEKLTGQAVFTHDIPGAPLVHSPPEGATVDPDDVVIDWDPVVDPPGIQIVEYEVIATQISPKRTLSIHVPAAVDTIHLPPEFFEPGQEYQYEVLAIEVGGNQTISEGEFFTQ